MSRIDKQYVREITVKALEGDRASLAKLITLIEESMEYFTVISDLVWPRTLRAHIIGVTGMPGAGKSTLISRITRLLRKEGKTVGIIAIDPSSPISGGSLLGDRIRIQQSIDQGVFMRSMPARREGVLPWRALLTVEILDAAGYD
ncbi:MAG TPA: methylmalonyl Co-A mutase-associated GTPase MeaB, partial [Desulfurococcaceae archaeon]|nr:methylmalonyl Co-A mutase-associated GTPase MeaB [Desulfurococcaceae archaeon]